MTLALQLVTYFSASHLEALFGSLTKQTRRDWVLFVRDQSEDSAEEARVKALLEASGLSFVFEAGENRGFAAGHNALYAKHVAEIVALVNPDLVYEPAYFEEATKCLESRSELGSVQGVLTRIQDGQEVIDSLGLRVLGVGDVRDLGTGEPMEAWRERLAEAPMRSIFGVNGAAALFRRSALEKAASTHGGFFDERFFLYKEDVELAIRLYRSGFLSAVATRARAFHARSVQRGTLWQRWKAEQTRSDRVRVCSYVGAWCIYILHGEWRGSFRSWIRTMIAEAGRTVGLLTAPRLCVRAWREIFSLRASLLSSRAVYQKKMIHSWNP